MLINEKTKNAQTVIARPTVSHGGFVAGEKYTFTHDINGLYVTTLSNGHIKYEDFDGKSAHLWDGKDWDNAGHFEIVEIIKTEKQMIAIGQKWADILILKKSPEHKDRFLTTWGDKTALGIYKTITRLVEESNS